MTADPPANLHAVAALQSRLAGADLNLLVPLAALLDERSVTRAAHRVGLSQPAMSHALRRLRHVLKDPILVRQGGTMVPTPRAERLIGPVRTALHEASRVLNPRPFDPATDDRVITVAISTSTAFTFVPLLVAVLSERAPRVTLNLRISDLSSPTVFTDDEVDFVLLPEALRSPYPRQRLYDDYLVIIASDTVPHYPDARQLLAGEEHIAFEGGPNFTSQGYSLLRERGIEHHVYATVYDYLLVPHLVASGRFVSLHRLQVAVRLRQSEPLRMEPFLFPVSLGIDVVWNPWLTDTSFRDWLARTLNDAAAPLAEVALWARENHYYSRGE